MPWLWHGQRQRPHGVTETGSRAGPRIVVGALLVAFVITGLAVAVIVVGGGGDNKRDASSHAPQSPTSAAGVGQLTGDVTLRGDAPAPCKQLASSAAIRDLPRLLPQLFTEESQQAARSVEQAIGDMDRLSGLPAPLRTAIVELSQRLRAFVGQTSTASAVAEVERAMRTLGQEVQSLCSFPL